MDRFIVLTDKNNNVDVICLKSNMDRFIAIDLLSNKFREKLFKIQYG